MHETIAEKTVIAINPAGKKFSVTLSIGKPYEDDGAWNCRVGFDGLYDFSPDLTGDNSLQALCLGLGFLEDRVKSLLTQGWQFLEPGSVPDSFPIDAYFGIYSNKS